MQIRSAAMRDCDEIRRVYRAAQERMIRDGNPTQWGRQYPPDALIEADVRLGRSYLLWDGDGIRGVFALCGGDEPSYRRIEDGQWPDDRPYRTIHRVASDGRAGGVFAAAVAFCKARSDVLRIDTHPDNRRMQRLIAQAGFVRCGVIRVEDGSPRIAYQWRR